jgi:hypothetical protein
MARPWRIEYEGALYHVFSRGNNQQDIFVTDDDRYLFLDTIGQMSERFDIDIFAYALMDTLRFDQSLWTRGRSPGVNTYLSAHERRVYMPGL